MKLRLEAALADMNDDEHRTQLVAAEAEVDRLSQIVDRLLATAARAEQERPTAVELGELAERAAERWRAPAREANTELVVDGSPGGALAHAADVGQILDNLLDNALTYGPGQVKITTGTHDGRAFVTVRDHGPGIHGGDLHRATERFYRGSGPGAAGSGLGLAIVRELAEHDGGEVTISTAEGGGTVVEVAYPSAGPLTGA